MKTDILTSIRRELSEQADARDQASVQHFFKEEIKAYGVRNAAVNKIAAQYFPQVKPLGKKAAFALCEELFRSNYIEEALIVCEWAYRFRRDFAPDDFKTFEGWLHNYVNNWAVCDTLCNHTIGSFAVMYPQYIENLKGWTKSANRWLRRAAAVTLIIPAKKGEFLSDVFAIADRLLEDRDDLVQKGYGWLLKEASRQHQTEVFNYVLAHRREMPRTALRYAIEKMPPELRQRAMVKP
jgi:3-methyladenine DNA glycosylase AlkD